MLVALPSLGLTDPEGGESCTLGVLPHRGSQHSPVKLSMLPSTLSVSY